MIRAGGKKWHSNSCGTEYSSKTVPIAIVFTGLLLDIFTEQDMC
jgi:hypothetical protein